MEERELKQKVINLANNLALQESAATGKDYIECINNSLNEACERLGINKKLFIRLFL